MRLLSIFFVLTFMFLLSNGHARARDERALPKTIDTSKISMFQLKTKDNLNLDGDINKKRLHDISSYLSSKGCGVTGSKFGRNIIEINEIHGIDSDIDDKDVIALSELKTLKKMFLCNANVTDKCVPSLKNIKDLSELWLNRTKITKKSLVTIKQLKSLKLLCVWDTKIKIKELKKLKKDLPNCEIIIDVPIGKVSKIDKSDPNKTIEYYASGNVKKETPLFNGKNNGFEYEYYDIKSRKLKSHMRQWSNGVQHGPDLKLFYSGTVMLRTSYQDGRKQGPEVEIYVNGVFKRRVLYDMNKKKDDEKFYDKNKNLIKKIHWEKDGTSKVTFVKKKDD